MNRHLDSRNHPPTQAHEVARFLETAKHRHLHPADLALAVSTRFPDLQFSVFATAVALITLGQERRRAS